ncbi:MAG TPA: hypothetical protein VE134_01215, partial [Methanomicrobiales archaeon]|nr:hypothetical protein [Methanomicrobiales archaeon]
STDVQGAQERSRTAMDRMDSISSRIDRLNTEIAALGVPGHVPSYAEWAIQEKVRHWEERGALRERRDQHQNLLQGIGSGTCPTCQQVIPKGGEEGIVSRIQSTLSEVEKELKQADERVLWMGTALSEAEQLRKGLEESRVKGAELRAERTALQDELAFQRKSLESLRREIAAYEDRSRIQRRVEEERNFLAEVQLAIEEFRGNVRSVMAQDLENAANSFMRKFSDGDFDAELRITEDFGFETLLHGERVPLSNLSGAARDILAFSLRYGLYRIAAKEVSFLLLDEPTHHFDRSNTRKLKEALNGLTDHQVIIITVNNEFSDALGRKFMVEKDSAYNSVIRAL